MYCHLSLISLHLLIFARNLLASTEDGRPMTTFYFYSVNHLVTALQRNTFSKLSYFFLINQNVLQIKYVISFKVYDGFIG